MKESTECITSTSEPKKSQNSNKDPTLNIFTKEEENKLKNHLIKCTTQYGITNTEIRKMVYCYARKIPHCTYPKTWDEKKMATIPWFVKFMSRHSEIKHFLKKPRNNCICIMGCHMGKEGEEALKKLEAKHLIAKVFHYLQKENEYVQTCNSIEVLMNVLRRTAEATGVCEQTITAILEEENRTKRSIHEDLTPKENNGHLEVVDLTLDRPNEVQRPQSTTGCLARKRPRMAYSLKCRKQKISKPRDSDKEESITDGHNSNESNTKSAKIPAEDLPENDNTKNVLSLELTPLLINETTEGPESASGVSVPQCLGNSNAEHNYNERNTKSDKIPAEDLPENDNTKNVLSLELTPLLINETTEGPESASGASVPQCLGNSDVEPQSTTECLARKRPRMAYSLKCRKQKISKPQDSDKEESITHGHNSNERNTKSEKIPAEDLPENDNTKNVLSLELTPLLINETTEGPESASGASVPQCLGNSDADSEKDKERQKKNKKNAEYQKKYRQRQKIKKIEASTEKIQATTQAQRQRNYRQRIENNKNNETFKRKEALRKKEYRLRLKFSRLNAILTQNGGNVSQTFSESLKEKTNNVLDNSQVDVQSTVETVQKENISEMWDETNSDDESKMEIVEETLITDLHRLQQACTIKSVKIEIMEDEDMDGTAEHNMAYNNETVDDDYVVDDDDELNRDGVMIGPYHSKSQQEFKQEEMSENEDVFVVGPFKSKVGTYRKRRNCDADDTDTSKITKTSSTAETPYSNSTSSGVMHYNLVLLNRLRENDLDKNIIKSAEERLVPKVTSSNDNIVLNKSKKMSNLTAKINKKISLKKNLKPQEKPDCIKTYTRKKNKPSEYEIEETDNPDKRILEGSLELKLLRWIHALVARGFLVTKKLLLHIFEIEMENTENVEICYEEIMKRYPFVRQLLTNVALTSNRIILFTQSLKRVAISRLLSLPSRVFNCDEISLSMISNAEEPLTRRYYQKEDSELVHKERLTVLINVCANGTLAPPMILCPEDETDNSVPKVPVGWSTATTKSGWTDADSMSKYIIDCFHPWLLERGTKLPVLLLLDECKIISPFLMNFCLKKHILLVGIPVDARHTLQPLDVGVFVEFEAVWKNILTNFKNVNNRNLNKSDFGEQVKLCLDMCVTPDLVKYGFRETNLVDIN